MFSNKDPNILRQIIIEHYEKPNHRAEKNFDKKGYLTGEAHSNTCTDNFSIFLKEENGKVKDVKFTGEGCAISTSSIDIMAHKILNKSKEEALQIITNYLNMVFGKDYKEDELDELIAFANVHKQANRIKCASIGIEGMRDILIQLKKGKQ